MLLKDFYSPFAEVERHLDGLASYLGGSSYPQVNIYKNDKEAILEAEIAGVHPENIDISVKGNVVSITGKKKELVGEDSGSFRSEIRSGEFARKIELGFKVDDAKVKAKVERGVLSLRLPYAEEEKVKKITVTQK